MKKILVTGKNGQVGTELAMLQMAFKEFEFHFTSRKELDITSEYSVNDFFSKHTFDYVLNCAAYTAVDKAEAEIELAFAANEKAVRLLASAAEKQAAFFVHLSTDYVFDGSHNLPYIENDSVNPLGIYGKSKLAGENILKDFENHSMIIRTSWVYNSTGSNFLKTMLRLFNERPEVRVVDDQIGSPTYAGDLARIILQILKKHQGQSGIFHLSNEGVCSWYDFAKSIADLKKSTAQIRPIPTSHYPTPAKRPVFSVLNKSKIKSTFDIEIPHWHDSLIDCIKLL